MLAVVLSLTLLADVAAGEAASVVPGARVRITAPSISTKRVIGQIIAIDADTLVLRHKPGLLFADASAALGTLRIPFDSLIKFEVSQGKHGAVKGGILGLVAGIGVVVLLDATDMLGAGHESELALIRIAPIGVVVCPVLGALIARRERWQPVPLDRIHIGILPRRHGRTMLSALVTVF